MTSLFDRLKADLVAAMKAGDRSRVETLRGLQSDLKYRQIELGKELTVPEAEEVLRRAAKKRRESLEAFRHGGRSDLADKEAAELHLISGYLPPELSDADLDAIIADALAEAGPTEPSQLGRVMKVVMPRLKGQAAGERVRARVQELLERQ